MNARQKNLLSLLAVAGVAGGLGLYAYFGVMKPQAEQTPAEQAPIALFPGAESAATGDGGSAAEPVFTSITVDSQEGRLVLALREGVWRLTSPVSALAERREVLDLVAELKHATFSAPVTDTPTDEELERYGLKPPRATVSARAYTPDAQGGGAGDPSREHGVTFELGIENVFDGSVYVRREGDPRVYLTHGALRVLLTKNVSSWRSHLLFDVEESSLLRIELQGREGPLVLERATTDKPWQMARPLVMRAETRRVARIFSDLKLYQALAFPSPETEARVLRALDKPQVSATLVPKVGGPLHLQAVTLNVDGFDQVFVRSDLGGEPVVAQVDAHLLTVLSPPALDFKSKKVLAMQASAVEKLVIHPGGRDEPLVLERTQETGRWEVMTPMPGRARAFKVASLLNSLEKLEAEAVVATGPKLGARYGITDTSPSVTLWDGAGQEIARLRLGNVVPGNEHRTWARGSSDDIYELSTPALKSLPLTLEELLDRGNPTP